MNKIKLFFQLLKRGWVEFTTVRVTHTYYYNGKKVKELPPEVKKEMDETFKHMDEVFKHLREIFK